MKMPFQPDLRGLFGAALESGGRGAIHAPSRKCSWREALGHSVLSRDIGALANQSVLVAAASQFDAALAMLEIDGVAARMVIAPPDLSGERLEAAAEQAAVGVIISDVAEERARRACITISESRPRLPRVSDPLPTEWVLPTSGTTGSPKLVAHRLTGLLGGDFKRGGCAEAPVWGTFYDIRRYGGMQVFLRAASQGASLVVTDTGEAISDHVSRMAETGVTHLTGTPTHWRRLLMSGEAHRISPRYVRLSGEIADRPILEALRTIYPDAEIIHAYASTEVGVGFEVADGLEGFPAAYLSGLPGVEMRVIDGSLRIRSKRTAERYVGREDLRLVDEEGFVDTGDLIEQIGDRCFFRGRRAGTINVGGLKVHPEEIEQVINSHGDVRMSLAKARRNPILGDLIVADVVLKDDGLSPERLRGLKSDILERCRASLARHKTPASINFVATLPMSAAGKLLRRGN